MTRSASIASRRDGRSPAQLAEAALEARPGSMRALIDFVAPYVLRTTRRILADPEDAKDVGQDSLIAFVRDLSTLREPSAVVGFAMRIAARMAVQARRRRDRRRTRTVGLPSDCAAPGAAFEQVLLARAQLERLFNLLDQLPGEQSEALTLYYVAELSPVEIATVTGTPFNTVRSRIRLARIALAMHLTEGRE